MEAHHAAPVFIAEASSNHGRDLSRAKAFVDAAADAGVPVNNLLEPLGDQWVLYEASSTGGFVFTGMTLVVDIRSKEHLDRVIGALVQLIAGKGAGAPNNPGGVLHTYEVDGVTIQYLQFNRSFDLPALITPAWAATGKKLVVALYPQVIEDAVRQLKADQSILDNPSFVATLKRTGGGGPLLYLSGPELARTLYPLALPIFAVLRGIGLADPGEHAVPVAELLPSLQRLLQYVGSDGVSIKLTPDGILRTKSVANPLLSPLTLTDSIPLWVAIALPSINAAKVTTDRVRSSGNLHQIGQALTLYANENQGKLPRDFATMIKTQDLKSELFQSPFGDGKGTGDYKYLFVEGMTNATPADVVLAYDTAGLERDDGTNVLYGDGHVEWLDHDGVVAALDKSSQWREEQMKKGK